jgi:RimJ/RimL family protein N-acetyltransferase
LPFDLQPLLSGTLVRLSPLRETDRSALFTVAADPLVWEQHPVKERYQEAVFQDFFNESLASGGALLVRDQLDDCVIGSSRFHGYDEGAGEVEIGWTFLARSHWGGRYNREVKELMLNHAFRFVDRVVFLVGPQNVRSQRAVLKIGGVLFGSRPDGRGGESLVYQITRSMPV